MKFKLLSVLLLGASLSASAQGFKDGIEYYKAGQYDNAITLLNRNMNNSGTDQALSHYYLGMSYLADKDAAKAKASFEAGVAANPECAYNYVGLGALQLKNGDVDAAKENFKKARNLAKKNSEVLVDIARAYYNADPQKYDKDIVELIEKARKQSKNQEPSIYVFEGDRLADAQDWNGAATQYEQAIYFDKDNPEGYVKYANVYYYINPDFAIDKLNELLQLHPNSALGQRELAEKYYRNGKWTRAAEQYGKYINNPNHFPEDKARYAVLLFAGDKFPEAIRISREVLAQEPNNFQANRVLVRSLESSKDPSALETAKKFLNNPEFAGRYNASDYTSLAGLLLADSAAAEALEVLQKAESVLPNNPEIYSSLSDYYFETKDYPKAADYIEKMLDNSTDLKPGDYYAAALNFLGATSATMSDSVTSRNYGDRGIKIMDKAMEGLELGQIPPAYIRRRALIATLANNNVCDQLAADAWKQLITRLNLDPANADPANDKNYLSYYVDAYSNLAKYYDTTGDETGATQAREELKKYQALEKGE